MTSRAPLGRIVTFYSYKGGTGRSMALANVAWLLASGGYRVLAIDWDLEAPGLHRYFEPFLTNRSLERATGIIDFVREFATAALSAIPASAEKDSSEREDKDWYKPYSNILRHALHLDWDFPGGGTLDFVPAGRQDAAYAFRVNSFDWQDFYEHLGGGVLLETVKTTLRELYDFVLIDSRTGVSDTSGICTIQMPDTLVVCFTLNRQSIFGASAAARSAFNQRRTRDGRPTLTIWPVPMRVELAEKDRLELAQTTARARFSGLMHQLSPEAEESYWGEIGVPYESYYAYEEVLATLRDRPRQAGSLLGTMEKLAGHLSGAPVERAGLIDEDRRAAALTSFTSHSANDFSEELVSLGAEYEAIRRLMPAGDKRTNLMSQLVTRAQVLGGERDAGRVAEQLFRMGTEGNRIVGVALARKEPHRQHVELAVPAIAETRSAFEQYQALLLAKALVPLLHPSAAREMRSAIQSQLGNNIVPSDPGRWSLAQQILNSLGNVPRVEEARTLAQISVTVAAETLSIIECRPAPTYVKYDDVDEQHGPWVTTRGHHAVQLPPTIRIGRYLVTNRLFLAFVEAGGYEIDTFWDIPRAARSKLVTKDGVSPGPADWPNARTFPMGKDNHPVQSISYVEARAFVKWCNQSSPAGGPWMWSLPPEDHWEFAARSDAGLIYPWGEAFDATKCNSSESGIGDTTDVTRFEMGASVFGCCDMAGNLWEFVEATDAGSNWCVLRGGSFKNDRFTVRSYLRLFGVPVLHRPHDFGFRLAHVQAANSVR